jgi:hypothetical protein
MTSSYGFNWAWVADTAATKRASEAVYQGGGTIYSFRQASGGVINSDDLSAFSKSVGQNLQNIRSDWRSYIRPVLNSLPAGNIDQRWSTDIGKGLPAKIDCFTYGVQGSTLFVFNDADATKADGRYWYAAGYRPKTIAEAFEDVYTAISDMPASSAEASAVDLDPLWAAIGEGYRDSGRVAAVGSLDTRTGTLETYVSQLEADLHEPTTYSYGLGTPLVYSVAKNIEELLKIHNVTDWQDNPEDVSHSGVGAEDHVHPYTDVKPPPAASLTQDRAVGTFTSLYNEALRLRYEIQRTRGSSSWYSDATDPVSSYADLQTHVNRVGSGTPSTNNPHGINMTDIGAAADLAVVRTFVGMDNSTDSTPDYSSTNYVTQNVSLETAIGELDDALYSLVGSTVVRLDYGYDRSGMSETDRANTAITVSHNLGRRPIVEVLDTSPTIEDYWGQYSSPAVDLNIVHVDTNQFEIWTSAAVIEVIVIG